MKCEGCGQRIVEGQHYLKALLEIDTVRTWKPTRELEPTIVHAAVHNPECLHLWAINNEIIEDVFYR